MSPPNGERRPPQESAAAMAATAGTSLPGTTDGRRDALAGLFSAPQLRTDDDGRHWDDEGREWVMFEIDGEAGFRLRGELS